MHGIIVMMNAYDHHFLIWRRAIRQAKEARIKALLIWNEIVLVRQDLVWNNSFVIRQS